MKSVLKFWFPAGKAVNDASMKLWFMGNPVLDQQIKETFEPAIQATVKCFKNIVVDDPESALGTIILLDQFPRNIYRGTGKMFEFDGLALHLANEAVNLGLDVHPTILENYGPAGRAFFYMPFEHSEDLEDQKRSVRLFKALADDHPGDLTKGFLKYAIDHSDIVSKFGRFPHRNALLDRESTPEESTFLAEGGATFGTSTKK